MSDDERAIAARIERVGVVDLPVLMPMLRAYCDFYEVDPRDDRLIALSRALIEDPSQGEQLIARDDGGTPLGFATSTGPGRRSTPPGSGSSTTSTWSPRPGDRGSGGR